MCAHVCVTRQSNMASILSLTDDCLHRIVSFIDDPSSFYSITLTCKRLLQITSNTRSVLHTNLVRLKAEYFMKCFVVENGCDYDKFCRFRDFLNESARLIEVKGMLSYNKVIEIWQRNGPVVAKLFTWFRDKEFSVEEGEPRATCFTEHRKVELYLPRCGKRMVIETSYFNDYGHNYDPELSIRVTCGDLDVTSQGFARYSPVDYMYWEEKEVAGAVEPMKGVIALLQKELGETVPSITSHFFIWLCYFFPDASNLDEAHRLTFKDAGRNVKPSYASVQPAINEFQQDQQIETKLQRLVAELNREEDQKSKYSCLCAEAVRTLSQRSEAKILKQLEEHAPRFRSIVTDYDMRQVPKQLLLDLVLRTSLEKRGYRPGAIADKYVEGTVYFRCVGGKVMKVHGSMHGDGASYPTWDEMELKFTLPNGDVLSLEGRNRPLQIEDLTPVTELLRQGVSLRMEEEKHIPNFGNLFTAAFFLSALGMNVDSDTFLGRYDKLIPPDSEDDSAAEELSESEEELSE